MSENISSSSPPLDQPSSNNCKDPVGYETDSDDEPTAEDLERYFAALEASEGFDVPILPGATACCLVRPFILTDLCRRRLEPFCVAGMNHYNQDKKTNYEFVRLVKATYKAVGGIEYFLTFEGSTPENDIKIFEANVLDGFRETEVYFCREKFPTKSEMQKEAVGTTNPMKRIRLS